MAENGSVELDGFDPWEAHWHDIGETPSSSQDLGWTKSDPALPDSETAFRARTQNDVPIWSPLARPRQARTRRHYSDGETVDWLHEDAAERERQHGLRAQRGLRGLLALTTDAARIWLVVVATGIGIGVVGAWLDVLVRWLGDLREGRCSYGFFYNQVACCSGLDPGEICREWQTWSEWLHVRSIFGQSLLQALIYIALAVVFAGSSAVLVKSYAPYAFHTGIPEIKAILGGYVLDAFLSPWALLIKALGLALSVASGLALGKEGPLVHVACCMAFLLSKLFPALSSNESQKRKLLAAAAAAGVSVAFGSPLGGVLFGLEELDTFASETDVMWRGFVTSVIAAMSLQYVDPFGTSKLVLFQVTGVNGTWRAFELGPWLFLGTIGGCLGALLIKANAEIAVYRRNSPLNDWPILEVVGVTAVTGAISYLVVFLRVQSSELVANLFMDCDPARGDYHGLCNPTALWRNVFLLSLSAAVKVAMTAWTFGMMIPAGIFLPSIAIGASIGRAVGLLTQGLHRAYPTAWIFASCPPDHTVRCISPELYAVIGAASMLAGVTRMTISLVVILFELTGVLSHVLPIMIAVATAKFVGDAFGKEGIYSSWIAMKRYPWLPRDEYHDQGETGATVMRRVEDLVVVQDGRTTLGELEVMVNEHAYHGFPVVQEGRRLMGFVARDKLKASIQPHLGPEASARARICTFGEDAPSHDREELSLASVLEDDVLQLRMEMPLELVVNMFKQMNIQNALFTQGGVLLGLTTKTDVVDLLAARFPHTAALENWPEPAR